MSHLKPLFAAAQKQDQENSGTTTSHDAFRTHIVWHNRGGNFKPLSMIAEVI